MHACIHAHVCTTRIPVEILKEESGVLVSELLEADIVTFHSRDYLVVNIGQVANVIYIIAAVEEPAFDKVIGQESAKVSNVCKVVDSGTTRIHFHSLAVGSHGLEGHLVARQRVEDIEFYRRCRHRHPTPARSSHCCCASRNRVALPEEASAGAPMQLEEADTSQPAARPPRCCTAGHQNWRVAEGRCRSEQRQHQTETQDAGCHDEEAMGVNTNWC